MANTIKELNEDVIELRKELNAQLKALTSNDPLTAELTRVQNANTCQALEVFQADIDVAVRRVATVITGQEGAGFGSWDLFHAPDLADQKHWLVSIINHTLSIDYPYGYDYLQRFLEITQKETIAKLVRTTLKEEGQK